MVKISWAWEPWGWARVPFSPLGPQPASPNGTQSLGAASELPKVLTDILPALLTPLCLPFRVTLSVALFVSRCPQAHKEDRVSPGCPLVCWESRQNCALKLAFQHAQT